MAVKRLSREFVMKKKVIVSVLSVIILSEIICIAGMCVCEGKNKDKTDITIREIPQQTVLYTVCRGDCYKINDAIKELYALAKSRQISPCGPVSTCSLSNSMLEKSDHDLVEIQIPVEEAAIEKAGTFDNLTDVKVIPAMKAAVAIKPGGYYNTNDIITNLLAWISRKGYVVRGRMREILLRGGDEKYRLLKSEFLIPIDESHAKDRLTITMDPCYM